MLLSGALYVGTYTGGGSAGLYRLSFDNQSGEVGGKRLVAVLENPSYLIFSPDGSRAYAVSETGGGAGGGVCAYAVGPHGEFALLDHRPTGGDDPCHLCLAPDGSALYVANYTGGSFTRLPLDSRGGFVGDDTRVDHHGCGPNPERQERPHLHYVGFAPGPPLLWTVDLGTDSLVLYDVRGDIAPAWRTRFSMPPGSGPRHVAFHPQLPTAYVVQELANRVDTVRLDRDGLPAETVAQCSTLPRDWTCGGKAGAILLHGEGRLLFVTNRGHDSIAVFVVGERGDLTLSQIVKSIGVSPRDLALSPDGNWLLCAHQDGGGISVFQLEAGAATLRYRGSCQEIASPVCLKFRPNRVPGDGVGKDCVCN